MNKLSGSSGDICHDECCVVASFYRQLVTDATNSLVCPGWKRVIYSICMPLLTEKLRFEEFVVRKVSCITKCSSWFGLCAWNDLRQREARQKEEIAKVFTERLA